MHPKPILTLAKPKKVHKEIGFEFLDPNTFNELQKDIEKLKSKVTKMLIRSSMPLERIKPSDPINESNTPPKNQRPGIIRPCTETEQGSPLIDPTYHWKRP